jgi:hypothetical protein
MNNTFKLAISVVLGAAMVTPAFAQRDGFSDVADTHWAYEAVTRLKKEGIITGYPDGTFQGKKMITRYEMATLIYAIYTNLKNVTDGLSTQIDALEARLNAMNKGGGGSTGDAGLGAIRDQLSTVRSEMSSMKSWGDEITMLKKMSDSYQKELSSLGVDVEAMKKDLADLNKRVMALESKKNSFSITGDANFFVAGGSKGTSGNAPINQDGRFAGGSATGAGLDTLTVLHELGLSIKTDSAKATIVVGNMVGGGSGFGDQASVKAVRDTPYGKNGNTNIYLHEMYANLSDSLVGMNFDAKVGRQGIKISPFVLQRLDNTSFFEQERYDNGEYAIDGLTAALNFGANTKLGLFLGQASNQIAGGGIVQPLRIASEGVGPISTLQLPVARTMGATLNFGLGDNGSILASYVTFDADGPNSAGANRMQVFGADLNYKLGGNIHLTAGTGQSTWKNNNTSIANTNNKRTNAGVSFAAGDLTVGAGYRKIESNYWAPGDWGRFGIYRNLNNVKGFDASLGYKLGGGLNLRGAFAQLDNNTSGARAVESSTVGLGYKLNGNWTLDASYEDTKFKNAYVAGNPTFKFTTLGFGYDMGANTLFKLWYQYSDIQGITFAGAGANPKGGFFGAQLSVKF